MTARRDSVPVARRVLGDPTRAAVVVGAAHALVVFGAMLAVGYPLLAIDSLQAALEPGDLFVGLFLVGALAAFVARRWRLVSPVLAIGLGALLAVIAAVTTPGPEFATLESHTLVEGPTYLEWYADGRFVWLLAGVLAGAVEYVVRTSTPRLADPRAPTRVLPLSWRPSLLAGLGVGVAHAVVVLGLAYRTGGEGVLSGFLLGWGALGLVCLGAVPAIALVRYRLVVPMAILTVTVLAVGVDAVSATLWTPAESYALFWPVYALFLVFSAVVEALVRFLGRRANRLRRDRRPLDAPE